MTDIIFNELAKAFEREGQTIERIHTKSVILFNLHPFTESLLGWDKACLSHFTVMDCIPLAELSEDEILSGSRKLKGIIRESIEALKIEEENMKELKRRSLSPSAEKNQMLWF